MNTFSSDACILITNDKHLHHHEDILITMTYILITMRSILITLKKNRKIVITMKHPRKHPHHKDKNKHPQHSENILIIHKKDVPGASMRDMGAENTEHSIIIRLAIRCSSIAFTTYPEFGNELVKGTETPEFVEEGQALSKTHQTRFSLVTT